MKDGDNLPPVRNDDGLVRSSPDMPSGMCMQFTNGDRSHNVSNVSHRARNVKKGSKLARDAAPPK